MTHPPRPHKQEAALAWIAPKQPSFPQTALCTLRIYSGGAEESPLKGQWWLLVDLTAQTYPEVQQAPSSLQTILPPYLFAECCLRKIKDQELLWAALLSISPENLIPHARPLWPILSRVDLSFKGKRSGHLASMFLSHLVLLPLPRGRFTTIAL